MIEGDLTEQIIGAAIEVHKHWAPDCTRRYTREACVTNCVCATWRSILR